MPNRIQRKRTKGWTTPLDEQGRKPVYVGRGSRYGNPWTVVQALGGWCLAVRGNTTTGVYATEVEAMQGLMKAYTMWAEVRRREIVVDLAGKDLMCWCRPEAFCHADVLLELANGGDDRG